VVCQAEVIEELRGRVVELEGEVAELRARLSQNSRNSSGPPSWDGYAKPPAPRSLRRPSGRRPGGQAGHEGHHLERVEHPDEVIGYSPARCTRCGSDLADADVVGVRARQVFDLPVVALAVSEHRAEDRRCGCGVVTGAAFPGGVAAPAQYGPRLRSLALYLIVYQHLPYERAARLLSDCLGATISTGTLHAIVEHIVPGRWNDVRHPTDNELKATAVLAMPIDEASAKVRKSRAEFLAAHPTETAVVIHGTIAIVSYFNPQRGVDQGVSGADVLVYEGGRWHAVYSLHNGTI